MTVPEQTRAAERSSDQPGKDTRQWKNQAKVFVAVLLGPAIVWGVWSHLSAEGEIAAEGTPLYEKAVEHSVAQLAKDDPEAPPSAQENKDTTPRDQALWSRIGDLVQSQDRRGRERSYIWWSERRGEFLVMPRRTAEDDVLVYWDEAKGRLTRHPLAGNTTEGKKWAFTLSSRRENLYVYWDKQTQGVGQSVWDVTPSAAASPVAVSPAMAPSAAGGSRPGSMYYQGLPRPNPAPAARPQTAQAPASPADTGLANRVKLQSLLGMTAPQVVALLGKPAGAGDSLEDASRLDYSAQGLVLSLRNGAVRMWTATKGCKLQTLEGVGIASGLEAVAGAYGKWDRQEDVEKWFAGDDPNVLYHHAKYERYKLNYPSRGLVVIFDSKRQAEVIYGQAPRKEVLGPLIPVDSPAAANAVPQQPLSQQQRANAPAMP